ncbi:MFS transporter [Ligilactobacillus equi]|uniref:MDR family MFS transporter n=1 Tax=Ligilactobacillus equi TaxID=137357 RepID=UPI002ED4DB9F
MQEFFTLPKQIQLRELIRFITITLGSSVYPFMAMYYTNYFGAFWTGVLMMITSLAGFVGTLYGGHLSDAIGRKKVVVLGSIGTSIGWFLTILANFPHHVLPGLTFVGILIEAISSNFYQPAYEAMLIDLTDESNRRFVYTISYWFINIAVMLGAGISGLFYDQYFLELLIGLFLVNAICFFITYFYFDETKSADADFEHGLGIFDTFKNYGEVLTDKIFVLYAVGSTLFASAWLQMDNYVPVHLKLSFQTTQILGITITGAKMLSVMIFTNTILIVIFMTLVNRLTKPLSLMAQLISGSVIYALGMLFCFTFESFLPLWLAVVFFTIGEMVNVPASQVLRADMMDENKIGSYSGFISMSQPLGSILASSLVSLSYFTGRLGVQIAFIFISGLGLSLVAYSAHQKLRQLTK